MIQELFIDHLIKNLQDSGITNIPSKRLRKIISFLIHSQLISTKTIRHFTIIREYEEMVQQEKFRNKTLLIRALSRKLDAHENTIWNILKDYKLKYQSAPSEKIEQDQ